jgi:hypothetical protein
MELMDQLDSAKNNLFRFEKLQYYDEGDNDAGLKKFIESGELPLTEMQQWFDFIKKKISEKILMQRVRFVTFPETDYTKYELAVHRKSIEAGDDIRVILDSDYEKLGDDPQDFWLIDDKTTLLMNYEGKGTFADFEVIEDPKYSLIKELMLSKSIPLSRVIK